MFVRELSQSIDHIKSAGPSLARNLTAAGLPTVASLLTRYPRDYEDRSRNSPLKEWNRGPVKTKVKIIAHDWIGFGKMKTLKVHIEDETARAVLVCFNRNFLQNQLPVGESVCIWGKFYYKFGELQSTSFEIENPDTAANMIYPIYPLSKGLNQKALRRLVQNALNQYCKNIQDELPQSIIEQHALLDKPVAIKEIHFPSSMEMLDKARAALIYEELFYLEIMIGRRSLERKNNKVEPLPVNKFEPRSFTEKNEKCILKTPCSSVVDINKKSAYGKVSSMFLAQNYSPLQQRLIERLPFKLTTGQTQAITEINADMASPWPLARLLQGDVGSGKTLVAFLACLAAIDKGGQAAIMAPTELLARQHADTAAKLLEPLGIRPAYLTGNVKNKGRAKLLEALAKGDIDIVLGTHALFSKDVEYKNLRFVVIDEQHRFGVTQRQKIIAKGQSSLDHNSHKNIPDLLMMSATPIPRTLALTVFGDLDVSVISDMPPGRKPVKTHLAKESNTAKVYEFVRKELQAGRQAYFVFPLIGNDDNNEDSDDNNNSESSGLKDAVSMAEKLAKEVFPNFTTALVHSKIDDEEKRATMDAFRAGDVNILAATSVVEVGVDVPNASCMVIHHAERFGLSALHQLRGRVGRGPDQAYCFLIYSDQEERQGIDPKSLSEQERSKEGQRLMVMLENADGFVIAEKDLIFRGPGQIAGVEQSGFLKLNIADPIRDSQVLIQARADAFAILADDPALTNPEHKCIADVLERAPPFSDVVL